MRVPSEMDGHLWKEEEKGHPIPTWDSQLLSLPLSCTNRVSMDPVSACDIVSRREGVQS